MNKYKTIIKDDSIELTIMGRSKKFAKNEIVYENNYTKSYPKIFKKIGLVEGYDRFLSEPKEIQIQSKKSIIKPKKSIIKPKKSIIKPKKNNETIKTDEQKIIK